MTKHKLKKSSKGLCKKIQDIKYFKISYFKFTDQNLIDFLRYERHDVDCVINALELIKIINTQAAGIMRILIKPSNGIRIPVIQNIFSFIYPGHIWRFKEYNRIEDFKNRIVNNFPIDNVIFCGITYNDGSNHVYLIGKDSSTFWIIDGQLGFCNLSEIDCYEYLKNAKTWYILEYM